MIYTDDDLTLINCDPRNSEKLRQIAQAMLDERMERRKADEAIDMDDVAVAFARYMHNTYEQLAPSFGYETRTDTRDFDPESANGKLMIAVCKTLSLIAHPPTQPSTSQAKVGEADVHRLLKDTLFACIATGKDQAVYGGVAYKGGAAKIAFSIEKPTADPELQGGDDDFETWFSKQDSRTEWLDLVRLAYAVQAEPAQAARSIALTDLLAAVDSFLKRPGPKIEGTNGAHICLGSYYRRMRNARKSMSATAPTQAKDSQ